MKPKTTRVGLALALGATLLAAYFAPAPASDTRVVPTGRPSAEHVVPPVRQEPDVLRVHSRHIDAPDDDEGLFASLDPSKSGKAASHASTAPAAVPAASAAPEPQAPPLPFRVLGRYVEDGETVVFLAHNEQNLAVRIGDTIGQNYKVEGMQGGTLNLLYLPLNQTQTLEVGGDESRE